MAELGTTISCPPRAWHAADALDQPVPSSVPALMIVKSSSSLGCSGVGGGDGDAGGDGAWISHVVKSPDMHLSESGSSVHSRAFALLLFGVVK